MHVLRSIAIILAFAAVLALGSAVHQRSLYVGRHLWTTEINPSFLLNSELVPVRGWPASFLVKTPLGWRFTPAEFVMNAVLAIPLAAIGFAGCRVLRHRRAAKTAS
jgi:hypothetical protein